MCIGDLPFTFAPQIVLPSIEITSLVATIKDKTTYKYPYLLKELNIVRVNQVWDRPVQYISAMEIDDCK